MNKKDLKLFLRFQKIEINHHFIYKNIAKTIKKDAENIEILNQIACEELTHYNMCKEYTSIDIKKDSFYIAYTSILASFLGYTFIIKMMEKSTQEFINKSINIGFLATYPNLQQLIASEKSHEEELIGLLNEEKLKYVGSMVLGLNDALMEITGSLAGFTFAYQDNRIIALAGIIVGFAATLSMAASNFLAERADGQKNALKSSFYTGGAYLITVVLLVLPYTLFHRSQYMQALTFMMAIALLIILFFNFYIAVAKNLPFKKRFTEMAAISLCVALTSFFVGVLLKTYIGVDI